MKTNKRYQLAAVLALIGVALFTVGFAGLGFDASKLTTDDPYEQKQYTASGDVRAVSIEDENIAIRLVAAEDSQVRVEYMENEKRFYTIEEREDGTLSIRKEKKLIWTDYLLNLPSAERVLTVALPKGFDGDVSIRNGNGDLSAESVSAANVDIRTSNQTTTLRGVTLSGGLSVDAGNSTVWMENVAAAGTVHAGVHNGRLTLENTRAYSVTAETNNAAVSLTAVTADTSVSVGTINGGITLDRLLFGTEMHCTTANGAIRGTVTGELGDFSFACSAANGECNLPKSIAGGDKGIKLSTINGDVDVSFVK